MRLENRSSTFDLIWSLALVAACGVGLVINDLDFSLSAIRIFVFFLVALILRSAFRNPVVIGDARNVFWIGIIYTILLNPVLGSEQMKYLPASAMMVSSFLIGLFVFFCMVGFKLARFRSAGRAWERVIPRMNRSTLVFAIWSIFMLELARRLYFVDWSFSELASDTLKARSGEVRFGRGRFGDWRVFLQPAEMLAVWLPCLVAYHWRLDKRILSRLFTLLPMLVVLTASFFGGSRGALATPLAAFFAFMIITSPKRAAKKYFFVALIASTLLAPLMDLMVKYRGVGWSKGVVIENVIGNPITAHRDSNFEALSKLVDVVPARQEFRSPFELYFFMLIAPIPRVLWPSKPYMSQEYLGDARAFYASISIVGDTYFYGGWLHVCLAGFVYGFLVKWLQQFFCLARKKPELALLYILFAVAMVWGLRAIWSMVSAVVIIASFLVFVVMMRILGFAKPVRI